MEAWERVLYIMQQENLNKNSMSVRIGLNQNVTIGSVVNEKKNPRPTTLRRIADAFPRYNRDWVLAGEEPILNSEFSEIIKDENKIKLVPLMPISAQGGTLNDFVVSVKESGCEKIVSPIRNVDLAITVQGDSMAPEFPNGSTVFVQKINEKAFIDWGKAYVLDTCNGVVIKTLVPSEKEENIKCVSINQNPIYAPFEIETSAIYGIYRIKLCLSLK